VNKTLRKQTDVEPILASQNVGRFLFRREQIKKQRGQSGVVQRARDKLIPWTMPAAPTPVREKNQASRIFWNGQITGQNCAAGLYLHFADTALLLLLMLLLPFSALSSKSKSMSMIENVNYTLNG
jgi:hypothetical protein